MNYVPFLILEIRGEPESGSGGGPVHLRRAPVVSEANGASGGSTPSNGIIPSDLAMMEPLLQDQAFQQQILQVCSYNNSKKKQSSLIHLYSRGVKKLGWLKEG